MRKEPCFRIGIILFSMLLLTGFATAWQKEVALFDPMSINRSNELITYNATGLNLSTDNCTETLVTANYSTETELKREILDYSGQAAAKGSQYCLLQFNVGLASTQNATYAQYNTSYAAFVYYGSNITNQSYDLVNGWGDNQFSLAISLTAAGWTNGSAGTSWMHPLYVDDKNRSWMNYSISNNTVGNYSTFYKLVDTRTVEIRAMRNTSSIPDVNCSNGFFVLGGPEGDYSFSFCLNGTGYYVKNCTDLSLASCRAYANYYEELSDINTTAHTYRFIRNANSVSIYRNGVYKSSVTNLGSGSGSSLIRFGSAFNILGSGSLLLDYIAYSTGNFVPVLLGSTATDAYLNISIYNEKNLSQQLYFLGRIYNGSCEVNIAQMLNYSSNVSGLCSGLNSISVRNDSYFDSVTNTTLSFPMRNYYVTISNGSSTLSNVSFITLNGHLLRSDQGIYYAVITTDYNNNPIPNTLVTASKYINGVYTAIEQEITDTSGVANFFLDFTTKYQFKAESGGYISQIFYLVPSTSQRAAYIKLSSTGSIGATLLNLTTIFTGITYGLLPPELIHNDSFLISYILSSSSGALQEFGINVFFHNSSNATLLLHEVRVDPSGATITYTTPNWTGQYTVETWFTRNEFLRYNATNRTYVIYAPRSISGISVTGLGWEISTLQVIAILIIGIIIAFFSKFNAVAGAVIGLIIFGTLTFGINIFPWEWFAFTFMLLISYIWLTRAPR